MIELDISLFEWFFSDTLAIGIIRYRLNLYILYTDYVFFNQYAIHLQPLWLLCFLTIHAK